MRVNGEYRGESFTSKAAARRWANQIEGQLYDRKAGIRTTSAMTLGDLVDLYLEEVVNMPGQQVGRTKLATLKMLSKRMAKVRLDNLDAALDTFINERRRGGTGGVTIAADLSFLSTVLQWAATVKNIAVDEMAPRRARASLKVRGMNTRSRERDRIPTDAELQRLYAHWAGKKRQQIPMERIVRFALATGMRQSEICRIRIEEIDWQKKSVLISQRKDPRNKATNDQIVPLLADAIEIAKEQAGDRKAGRLFPFKAQSVKSSFADAVQDLKIEDLHFHDLRHAATTSFFRMGLPIQLVALITGHKSWENLRRYTQLSADDVHRHLAAQ